MPNCQDWTLEATQKRPKRKETTTKDTYRVVKKMWLEMAGRTRFLDVFIKNTYRVVKKMWFEMAGRTRFLDVFIQNTYRVVKKNVV